MAELKTKSTETKPPEFLDALADEQIRADCYAILQIMQEATGAEPKMWGTSIVGFGHYHYQYESGREGDWFLVGFSPRKQNLSLYIMAGFDQYAALLEKLGKYKTGASCLYIKRLSDVDLDVLRELIQASVAKMSGA